jgi:predicted nuclease with RNAse H fold
VVTTHGIDLAVQPHDTAWATITWPETGRASLQVKQTKSDGRADNENVAAWLTEAARNGERVGIDVPLGWPDSFAELVRQHSDLAYRPSEEGNWKETYAGFRLRKTDQHVAEQFEQIGRSVRPLSVSADKLGATAMRAAWLLGKLEPKDLIDRSGMEGVIVEVYPAAALAVWGLPHTGYKSGDNRRVLRDEIWEGLRGLFADAETPTNDHQLDAIIAAIVAHLRSEASGPPSVLREVAKREGWIHVPTGGSLEGLLESARAG